MNKKIASEIAIGVILCAAIIFGIVFFLNEKIKTDDNAIVENSDRISSRIDAGTEKTVDISTDKIAISEKVKDKCRILKNNCNGDCHDCWSSYCFYDSSKNKESDFQLGFEIEPKNLCFGLHSERICNKCYSKFEIREENYFKEVNCEEFYQRIENQNNECGDCLKEIISAS